MISAVPYVRAASVPVIDATSFNYIPPPTCDSTLWEALKAKSWMAGQREITQNNNLIARPDSVLSTSCFHVMLNYLALYADENFPGNPDESRGGFGGRYTDTFIIIPDELRYNINQSSTQGFLMYSVLELLVLDQLVSATDAATRAMDMGDLGSCSGKEYYINSNYPERALGDRDLTAGITLHMPNSVVPSIDAGCPQMNNVWKWSRTKCYNFNSEPLHDDFYSFLWYNRYSQNGGGFGRGARDFRTKDNQCLAPRFDGSPDFPTNSELACYSTVHSTPSNWNESTLWQIFFNNVGQNNVVFNWSMAYFMSNFPVDESASGVLDPYMDFLDLRDSTSCSSLTPIKTGFIVSRGATKYVDAFCPAPGCYFDPPATIAGNGTCN